MQRNIKKIRVLAGQGSWVALGLIALLGSAPAAAQSTSDSILQGNALYMGVGTYGISLGYAAPVDSTTGVRIELSGVPDLHRSRTGIVRSGELAPDDLRVDDFSGKASVAYQHLAILGDYFVREDSGFRLTGGLQFNRQLGSGNARILTANAMRYYTDAASGQRVRVDLDQTSLSGSVTFPKVTPYLGLGWGHNISGGPGWGFFADVGVVFGRHSSRIDPVNLKFSVYNDTTGEKIDNAQTQAKQAEVAAAANQTAQDERTRLQKELDRFRVWPQIAVGVSYRF